MQSVCIVNYFVNKGNVYIVKGEFLLLKCIRFIFTNYIFQVFKKGAKNVVSRETDEISGVLQRDKLKSINCSCVPVLRSSAETQRVG